jgi:hypothetical protein
LHQGLFYRNLNTTLILVIKTAMSLTKRLFLVTLNNLNNEPLVRFYCFFLIIRVSTFTFFRISCSSTTPWWVSTEGWTTVCTTTSSRWGVAFEKSSLDTLLTFNLFLEILCCTFQKFCDREANWQQTSELKKWFHQRSHLPRKWKPHNRTFVVLNLLLILSTFIDNLILAPT